MGGIHARVAHIFKALGSNAPLAETGGLKVFSPADGSGLASIAMDTPQSLEQKIASALSTQQLRAGRQRELRVLLLEAVAAGLKQHQELLAELIMLEGGKTMKEALGEVASSADVLLNTVKNAALPEMGGMLRSKERPPVGMVGLITSFNFPLAVANWTIAPALLAGNAVLWKPSEKTPLTALAYKAIFDHVTQTHDDVLQIIIGGREIGGALVAHEKVDMVSATGSVAMGKGIRATLAKKKNQGVKPILELGGNNGVIISEKISPAHLEWSLTCLLNSFFGTSGQRCTNTRRLIIHRSIYAQAVALLKQKIESFIAAGAIVSPLSGAANDYGYGPLIDRDAYQRFEKTKAEAAGEGGEILFGRRLLEKEMPDAYYVEPALALLPEQKELMHEETFAPLLFAVPYDGDIDNALALLNAPANAGLVGGIYTQSRKEAARFAEACQAGHSLINPPKGTGTPAFGMGFGGNKDSGEGEILNNADPLRAFTREDSYHRIAQNKDVVMDQD